MDPKIRHFSPAEVATRSGVTVKALRVYERHGLLTPLRTAAGYRAYGPDQISRLHQVLALKDLGLTLARIAELLARPDMDLDGVLALQEGVLRDRRARIDTALKRLHAARLKIRTGARLTVEDLTSLTKETTLTDHDAIKTIFDSLAQAHFSEAELAELKARPRAWSQTQVAAEWEDLIAECKTLLAKGDPRSPAAMDLARRWMGQVDKFTQGDPKLFAKVGALWGEAMSDPASAPQLPLTPEMFVFIGKADAARKALEA